MVLSYGFWKNKLGENPNTVGQTLRVNNYPFTVIGVGDMSGDVFGNGMLLSRHIRLIAAFNHLHIVIDPDPDPERSWIERKRLFDLPRSTWKDYDRQVAARGEDALSLARNNTCTACHSALTEQQRNDLMAGRLVFCKSCGRIVYLADEPA